MLLVGPKGKLNDGQREAVKANRDALLALVLGESELFKAQLWRLLDRADHVLSDLFHQAVDARSTVPLEEAVKALLSLCPGSKAAAPSFESWPEIRG